MITLTNIQYIHRNVLLVLFQRYFIWQMPILNKYFYNINIYYWQLYWSCRGMFKTLNGEMRKINSTWQCSIVLPFSLLNMPFDHDQQYNHSPYVFCGKPGGVMVRLSVLNFGASDPGLSPGRGHCVVFLGKTLSQCLSPPKCILNGYWKI